ncbi:MAG: transposase [Sphingobium sp.]
MAHRSIGQERFGFAGRTRSSSSLDELGKLIDWASVAALLDPLYSASMGESAWPPLAMFKALLLSIWYDLSDVKLAEALDDRASFRRFCGFSGTEATPERTAFVRFREELAAHKLDRLLFLAVTAQLKSKAVAVKTACWSMPRSLLRPARTMMMRDGSNIKESGLFMASRLMNCQTFSTGFNSGHLGGSGGGGAFDRDGSDTTRLDEQDIHLASPVWRNLDLGEQPAVHATFKDADAMLRVVEPELCPPSAPMAQI